MAEKELAILVTAKNLASGNIQRVSRDLGGLGKAARTVGGGLATAAKNIGLLGLAAGAFLASQLKFGIDSLARLEEVEALTAAAIKSTGGAAGVTAEQVRAYAEQIEKLTTIDDKEVQSAENLLLTFVNIRSKAFLPATEAVVDMAVALARGDKEMADTKSAAILVGKALNDPIKGVTALTRVGVSFTKEQRKRIEALVKEGKLYDAQQLILTELRTEFGGAARATDKLSDKQRALGDAVEEAQMAFATGLLPVLVRASDWLRTKLAEPGTLRAIEDAGNEIASAFGDAVTFAESIDWAAIGAGLGTVKDVVKTAFDLFNQMPEWAKTAIITGWGLNKLTGGAVSTLVGQLGAGLIKGVLGMNAGVVNINAAVVRGGGVGLPGGRGGGGVPPIVAAGAGGGVLAGAGFLGTLAGVGGIAAGTAGVAALLVTAVAKLDELIEGPEGVARSQAVANASAIQRAVGVPLIAKLDEQKRSQASDSAHLASISGRGFATMSGALRDQQIRLSLTNRVELDGRVLDESTVTRTLSSWGGK